MMTPEKGPPPFTEEADGGARRRSKRSSKGHNDMASNPNYIYRGVSWKEYLWNPKTKEVLGRSALSWAKITAFYVAFYSFLAFFFAFMMIVFYSTLDEYRPKYTLEQSLLYTPGLSMRPNSIIEYNRGNPESYQDEKSSLHKFINTYIDSRAENRYIDCSDDYPPLQMDICDFNLEGLHLSRSASDVDWGFNTTSPSIILKLNRVFDWVPDVYDRNSERLPAELWNYLDDTETNNTNYNSKIVWLWCKAKVDWVSFTYSPLPGFPAYYYPFYNQRGYLTPFVIVTVHNLTEHDQTSVSCAAYARNIYDPSIRVTFILE